MAGDAVDVVFDGVAVLEGVVVDVPAFVPAEDASTAVPAGEPVVGAGVIFPTSGETIPWALSVVVPAVAVVVCELSEVAPAVVEDESLPALAVVVSVVDAVAEPAVLAVAPAVVVAAALASRWIVES